MQNDRKNVLKQSISKVLRPLIRLLLAQGVTYREFADQAKGVFFDAGVTMLKESGAKETSSQLSVLTGLHRKDITAFQAESAVASAQAGRSRSPGAMVVAEWISNPAYLDAAGHPRALPYAGAEGGPSFTALVESVSKDVRPKTHLEDLLRLGMVTVDAAEIVHLVRDAFVPSADFSEKMKFFTLNIGDHLSAAAENVQKNPAPFFDRSAFHDRLSVEDIAALRALVDEEGMQLLKKAYRRAEELSQNKKTDKKDRRITVGLYMYAEQTGDKNED